MKNFFIKKWSDLFIYLSKTVREWFENGSRMVRQMCAAWAMLRGKLVNCAKSGMQIFKLTKLTKLTEQIFAESLKCLKSLMQIFATYATSASANFVGKESNESTVMYRVKSRITTTCLRLASVFTLICFLGVGEVWGAAPKLSDLSFSTESSVRIVNENFNACSTTNKTAKMAANADLSGFGAFNKGYNNSTSNHYAIESSTFGSNGVKITMGSGSPCGIAISGKTFGTKGAWRITTTKASKMYAGIYAEGATSAAYAKANASVYIQNNAGSISISKNTSSGNWQSVGSSSNTTIDICVIYNNTNTAATYGNSISLPAKSAHVYIDGNCVMNGESPKSFTISGLTLSTFRVYPIPTDGNVAAVDDVQIWNALPTAAASGWKLKGSFDSWGDGYAMTGSGTVSVTRSLAANTRYEFKIYDGATAYGNNGAIVHSISDWTFATEKNNCVLYTGPAGDYTFSINTSTKATSVTYPSVTHPNANYVYIKKGAGWSDARIYNYQSGSDSKMSDWGGSPILASCEICDETYYYGAAYFNKIIFRDGGSNQSNEVSLDRGKWLDETTHADSWSTFDKYTISYDKGTGTGGSMSSHTGLCPGSNQALSANAFTKDHYHFTGWIADRDVTINSATVTQGTLITGTPTIENIQHDIALTAQWEVNSNTLTWNWGGGSTTSTSYTLYPATSGSVNYGTTITYPANGTMSKTGYNFSSWSSSATSMPDEALTITANWTAKTTSITLNKNNEDASGSTAGSASWTYDQTTKNSLTAATRTGYNVDGYYTTASSGTKILNADGSLAGNSITVDAVVYTSGGKWAYDGTSLTLYAHWTLKTTTVSFNQNSGTGGQTTTKTATYSQAMPTPITTPTRAGYTFTGYFENSGGTGTKYYNADGSSATNWDKENSTWTLYAGWTAKTDTYKTGLHTGASGWTSYASGVTKNGAGYTIPNPGSVAKGGGSGCEDTHYYFAGWVADDYKGSPSGHIISASGTTDATGTTYWAVWGDGVPSTTYSRLTSIAGVDEDAQYVLGIDGTGFHYSGTSSWGLTALPANQTPLYYTLTKEDAATPTYFTAATSVSSTTYYLQVAGTGAFNMTTSSGTDAGKLVIGSTTNYGGDDKAYAVSVKGTTTKSLRRNGTSGIRCYDNTTTGSLVFFYKVVTSGDIDYVTSCCELKPATSVTVASTTGTSATLSWTAPSPSTGISKLQVRDASDDAVLVDNLLVSATGATVTGLTECDEYTFYVASVGATCYTASESVDAQPYSGAKTVTYKYHDDVTPDGSFTTDCSHPSTTLPNPSRTGYTLNGWYTAADGGTKKGNGGASYTPDADITLHAQWTEKPKYTITLNAGNGTVSADGWTAGVSPTWSKTQANGDEEITFPAANPGCAGWVFKGWKQGSAASDQASFTPDKTAGETLTPTSDVTYYAVYRQSTPSGTTYTKITESAALATGDYAIVANNSGTYEAMGNATSSSHMTETTAANDSWTNSNADYIWKILVFGSKVAFYNADEGKFLTIVNGAWVLADDGQLFTYSFNSTTKAWTFTSPSGKQIGYDTWFNVRDTQDDPVYLYKRGDAESGNYFTNPSCSDYTITGEANPVAGGSVQLTAAAAKNGDKVWACYTADEDYNFTNWSVSGTSVSPTSATTQFVEITVGSGNVTATANFAEKVMYDITWKANGETLTGDDLGSASVRVENGHNITALPPAPTSCETGSGKSENFIGWVVDDQNWSGKTNDLTGITIYKKLSEFPAVDDDVTYHAVWAATDESTNEWVKVTSIDGISDGDVVAIIRVDEAYYLPNAESDPAPAVAAVTKTSGDINFVNAMKFTATAESGGYIFESVSASGKYLWAYNDNKGIYIKATDGSKGGATNLWFLEDYDDYNETSTGYGIVLYCNTYTTENHYRYLATYGTTDWRSYGSVTASNLPANVYVYAHGYKDYMTKCCTAPTLAFAASPYAVLREDLGGASTTTWAEVDVTFTSNSTGTISAAQYSNATVTNGTAYQLAASKWQVYETTGGTLCGATHAYFEVLTQPSGETPGTGKFHVKTAAGQTGQGTYRIAITQEGTDESHGNYCETTVYGFINVTLRDKFVDKLNGNGTVTRDGHGAQLATPTLSELDTQDEDACHDETRKLKGWIKESDLKSDYVTGTRVTELDNDAGGFADLVAAGKVVAPGANVTTSGATWYAVWAYEK